MIHPDVQNRRWQNPAARWRSQFRQAMIISVAAHLLLIAFLTVVVAFVMRNNSESPPRDLKFVFTPSGNEENQLIKIIKNDDENLTDSHSNAPPKTPSKNSTSQQTPTHANILSTAGQITQPRMHETGETVDNSTSPFADEIPIDLTDSPIKNAVDYAPEFRARKYLAASFGHNYKMSAATLPVAEQENEKIDAKLEEIIDDLRQREQKDTTLIWHRKEIEYTIKIDHQPTTDEMGFDKMMVEISRKKDGVVFTTEKQMRHTAFSHYAKFVDYWNPRIVLHDDEFDGRFHSNSAFSIMNIGLRPKFRGKVTTAAYRINTSGTPYSSFITQKDSVFTQGLETGTNEIALPKNLGIRPADESDSLNISFYEETWLNFEAEGDLAWHSKSQTRVPKIPLPEQPFIISGFEKGKLHVRGIVRGKILIYSTQDVIIDGSLTCKADPRIIKDSPDYIGVVSEKDIIIAAPKVTGAGDLMLHGAYFCKKRFRVKKFWHENNGAKMFIFGSITAGSVGATEPRYGTRVKFDKRLEKKRPPFFPMTDHYEIFNWNGRWQSHIE